MSSKGLCSLGEWAFDKLKRTDPSSWPQRVTAPKQSRQTTPNIFGSLSLLSYRYGNSAVFSSDLRLKSQDFQLNSDPERAPVRPRGWQGEPMRMRIERSRVGRIAIDHDD
jgi:hypothetical protein